MEFIPEDYLNREMSWLEFNQRVLDLAGLQEIPLLERIKFLAITGSNLDEFFKVRVGGLRLALSAQSQQTDLTGMSVSEQLARVTARVREMNRDQSQILLKQLLPSLEQRGIKRLVPEQIDERQQKLLEKVFDQEISSVVAPVTIERGQPFPLMVGAKQCICVRLRSEESKTIGETDNSGEEASTERFVVIPIGASCKRMVHLPHQSGYFFMLSEDVIGLFLSRFFPGQKVLDWAAFRITRNADIALNDDMMHDLVSGMNQMLRARKVSKIVRLELGSDTSPEILQFLQDETGASDDIVFRIEGALDLAALFELSSIPGFAELKDIPWPSQPSSDFADTTNIFETIATQDRILIHPYQQFDPVIGFIHAAAEDPNVIAIKQTLYRTSRDSEVINGLITAAGNGKQVTAIVELKARFDEERNIAWARRLEQAGVDVIYGVQGLKTHAKICIVVRRESRGIQRYVHFGTGNYNESTAKLYSDISYFTNNEQLGSDAVLFFNAITGLSVPQHMSLLSAAPIDLRESLLDLIQVEIENARQGGSSAINAKLNSLADKKLIDALYSASQAGVKIRLNIRGICCLKPGVDGLSENIEVVSIVDRLLEHSRIIHFNHGGGNLVYISSADWMGRNLNRRAELMVPIEDESCKHDLLAVLKCYFEDNIRASVLNSNGDYLPKVAVGRPDFRSQEYLHQKACDLYSAFANPKATVFKAHRGESA